MGNECFSYGAIITVSTIHNYIFIGPLIIPLLRKPYLQIGLSLLLFNISKPFVLLDDALVNGPVVLVVA